MDLGAKEAGTNRKRRYHKSLRFVKISVLNGLDSGERFLQLAALVVGVYIPMTREDSDMSNGELHIVINMYNVLVAVMVYF